MRKKRQQINIVKDIVAEYLRVSSCGQDLITQLKANEEYINTFRDFYEVQTFIDDGVSAIKIPLHQRPQMQQLIQLIKTGRVKYLVVYQRDRLARYFHEYVKIAQLLLKYNVKMIFSIGKGYPPFRTDIAYEFSEAIQLHSQTKMRILREKDKNRHNPSRKYGFIIEPTKKKGGVKKFFVNESQAEKIVGLYQEAALCTSPRMFIDLCKKHKKQIGCSSFTDVFRYLQDTYYCAHLEYEEGKYVLLNHVPQILSVDLYKMVKERIRHHIQYFENLKVQLEVRNFLPPKCGMCGSEMKFICPYFTEHAHYECRECKRKVELYEYNKVIVKSIKGILLKMDELKKDKRRNYELNELIKDIQLERMKRTLKIEELRIKMTKTINKTKVNYYLSQIKVTDNEIKKIDRLLQEKDTVEKLFISLKQKQGKYSQFIPISDLELLIISNEIIKGVYYFEKDCFDLHIYSNWAIYGLEELGV